ncbi:reticulophagy regulator 3 [Tachysurus vachellii]|uniref:reticulophagy regulator 3 n=1 Tax=Tachysurus vachellii TaxID=175792 RepID=UPI00296AE49C|nr:reticulophagy regulator 3 [Tachysurus vachellii]XP_060748835.1 reticulophagy regulator 3 [Tachysurus vachellii]XP_060748836.1 reticulophagy regulator 3 [Tachysurus vachellii]
MAQESETGDVDRESGESWKRRPGGGVRSRQRSGDTAVQVRAVKAALMDALGPHERLITYMQAVLLWEKPVHSVLLYTLTNCGFWFFALSSVRLLFLLALGLALVVCVDMWRNKIWPKIKVKRVDESENESWGLVQPGTMSVPELCHHMAEVWVSVKSSAVDLVEFKRHNPGQFCVLVCGLFSFLAMVGRYIPGVFLSYVAVWDVLLCPLAIYYRLLPRVCVRLEPALQWLDFSVKGYMMSKPIDNQFLRRPIRSGTSGDTSDSEEELAAFCPTFDEAMVAKELAMTDSEHSDAEVSYTENGTFNLSRGQTPLTDGSEELDRHSDPEESFAQDLPDFPSINPDATLMEDDDEPSLGLPSMGSIGISGTRASTSSALLDLDTQLDSDQDDLDTDLSLGGLNMSSDITGNLASLLASNMIQAALSGALQGPHGYRKESSSELDLDLDQDQDQDDFELLDQSELNQMDPLGGSGTRGSSQNRTQGSSFLSNLLGKPQ